MKLGISKGKSSLSITENEYKLLGNGKVEVAFDRTSRDSFITVKAIANGGGQVPFKRNDATHPYGLRATMADIAGLPDFKTEKIAALFHNGVLRGKRPRMDEKPTVKKYKRGSGPKVPEQPNYDHLREAVALINNFKRMHGACARLEIVGDLLVVKFVLEIGK